MLYVFSSVGESTAHAKVVVNLHIQCYDLRFPEYYDELAIRFST